LSLQLHVRGGPGGRRDPKLLVAADESSGMRVAFVCVQNAGRSQMAAAFARRAVEERTATDRIDVVTGGTDPADAVHGVVVEVMREVGVDLSGETPAEFTHDDAMAADVVVTMGCSAEGVCPMTWRGDARDWDLDDPHGEDLDRVREIRDEIRTRVDDLLDELLAADADDPGAADAPVDD
jgi:protein-tyrosine-phosphatase